MLQVEFLDLLVQCRGIENCQKLYPQYSLYAFYPIEDILGVWGI